jgi:tRNA(Arg) A34 adenosine deaminase TadA
MCLGAILWARLDRVWYAATQEQAGAAGFDDSNFYAQMGLPSDQRIIPMTLVPGGDANQPFLAWQQFSAKVPY